VNRHFMLKTEPWPSDHQRCALPKRGEGVACHPDGARDVSNVIRHIDQYPASALTDGSMK
jgi:hypothetical protein